MSLCRQSGQRKTQAVRSQGPFSELVQMGNARMETRSSKAVPRPHFDVAALRKLGGAPARERAVALLEPRLVAGGAWFGTSDLLIRLLIREKMFDAAWSILDRHGGMPALQQTLADASKASHPGKALAVYAKLVEEHAQFGRYEDAVRLVRQMAGLRKVAEHATYMADLKERHRRKRNFMKLL
jgi:hypothetical protein